MSENDPKSKIRLQIDENLKRIYNETLKEEIPDRFARLLDQLRDKTADAAVGDDRKKR